MDYFGELFRYETVVKFFNLVGADVAERGEGGTCDRGAYQVRWMGRLGGRG